MTSIELHATRVRTLATRTSQVIRSAESAHPLSKAATVAALNRLYWLDKAAAESIADIDNGVRMRCSMEDYQLLVTGILV